MNRNRTRKWRWPWQSPPPVVVRPPKVGGTRAPDAVMRIDFSQPHDFHFRLQGDYGGAMQPVTFRRCRLVGFTTAAGGEGGEGGEGFSEYAHNRWLVLEQEGGRRVYIPRDSLLYIEESAPADPPST